VERGPRLLHRDSSRGYTTNPLAALPAEPEALAADDLEDVGRRAVDGELRAWQTSRRRLLAEVEHLRCHVHSPHVTRAARAIARELDALDQKLAG
jgi:hypothetical protein